MRSDSDAQDPLEVMRSAPMGVSTPSELEEERARVVPWLEGRVSVWAEERARRRRRRAAGAIVFGAVVAAAAAVALVVGTRAETSAPLAASSGAASTIEVRLVEGSVESENARISTDSRFAPASHVRTGDGGHAVFEGTSLYRLQMKEQSELVFGDEPASSKRTHIRLVGGEIELAVKKLAPGRTLEVETADATVRVKGTRFVVRALERDGKASTCVRVDEGLVEVERRDGRVLLRAGESSGCERERQADATRAARASEVTRAEPAKSPGPKSSLEEESRLLAAALSAEKSGRIAEARAAFSELIRRYPSSRFSPEARAGLARSKAESAPR